MAVYNASATPVTQTALEQLQPVIEKNVIVNQPFLQMIERENVTQSGRFFNSKYIIPTTTAYPANARGVAEGTAMPAAATSTVTQMTASLKKLVAKSEITWEQTTIGGDQKAFKEDLKNKVKNDLVRGFRDVFQVHLFGFIPTGGTTPTQSPGPLGVIKSYTTAGGTITVYRHDSASNHLPHCPGTKWLRVTQPIATTAPDGSTGAEYGTVTSIVDAENFIMSGGTGLTLADHDIYLPGDSNGTSLDNVFTGLYYHVNGSGPTTYQGVTRATYPALYGNDVNNSGASRTISEALVQEAFDAPLEYSYTDFNVDCVISDPKLVRAYTDLFDTYQRYRPGEGAKGLNHTMTTYGPFNEKVIRDPYCNPGMIYFVDKSSFKLIHADDLFGFENENGQIFLLRGSNHNLDIYEVRSRAYCQLICDTPRKNTALKDLADAP